MKAAFSCPLSLRASLYPKVIQRAAAPGRPKRSADFHDVSDSRLITKQAAFRCKSIRLVRGRTSPREPDVERSYRPPSLVSRFSAWMSPLQRVHVFPPPSSLASSLDRVPSDEKAVGGGVHASPPSSLVPSLDRVMAGEPLKPYLPLLHDPQGAALCELPEAEKIVRGAFKPGGGGDGAGLAHDTRGLATKL